MKSPKNPIQVACPSQHIICIECFDRVFEVTEISDENKSVGKCFCRGEVVIEDCISAKSFERIIKTYLSSVLITPMDANGNAM